MTEEEYIRELESILDDTPHAGLSVTNEQLMVAFKALRQHRELQDGLFVEGTEPSDQALTSIFAFLVVE